MKAKYKELSDLAFKFQKEGRLEEALDIYNTLIRINPEDVNILNLLGMLYLEKKEYELAINYLSKAVVLNSTSYVVSNLAKAYYLNKQYQQAIDLYHKALEIEENDDILYSLGVAYKGLKNMEKALFYYNKSLEFNPKNYNAHYNLALLYRDLDKPKKAIEVCLKAKEIVSNDYDLYTLLSKLYEKIKDYDSAIKTLEEGSVLFPQSTFCYYNLGVLYSKLGRIKDSIHSYLKVILLDPTDFETMVNLAYLYKETDKQLALQYALKAYEINNSEFNNVIALAQIYRELYDNQNSLKILNEYLNLNSNSAEIYYHIAMNLMDIGEYSNALSNYNKALSFEPENLSYKKGKAIALKYLGDEKLAFEMLKDIYSKDGNSYSTAISLGMCYLKDKDFYNGMELYSKRSLDSKFSKIFTEKIWNKSISLNDKKILLYSYCGLGDTIMFARYIPLISEISESVTLQTDKELVPFLKQNYSNIQVISKTDERPEYDIVMPIMDISYALNSDFKQIPFLDKYLIADDQKVKSYKQLKIFNNNNLKVGICYQGNKRVLKNRSIDVEIIKNLFDVPNVTFYSFQLNSQFDGAIDLSEYISDYSDTAALLKCIDVLVTIDSSIVHVAGALGVKTYLMLPKTAEWRWFDDMEKSSWYNSVEIFKQQESNDWNFVIENIKKELENANK